MPTHQETITKSAELIEKSSRIGILLPDEPDMALCAAAEALAQTLEERGKTVGFLAQPHIVHSSADITNPFPRTARALPLAKEFIISLDTAASPASQVRYEKSESRIDIILSPKQHAIQQDAIAFREGRVRCDCAITIGVNDIERAADAAGLVPDFLTETPLITIGSAIRASETDIALPPNSALAQAVWELLKKNTAVPISNAAATLLLAGILCHTNIFRAHSISPESLTIASELMHTGAEYNRALSLCDGHKPLDVLQLLGRASVRSKITPEQSIAWSFLTEEDFLKTGRTPEDIPLVLQHLAETFPAHRVRTVLWQDPALHSIRATLDGQRDIIESIRTRVPSAQNSQAISLAAAFLSFQEAELFVSTLIRDASALPVQEA